MCGSPKITTNKIHFRGSPKTDSENLPLSQHTVSGHTKQGGRQILPSCWVVLVASRGRQGLLITVFLGGEAEDRDQLCSQSHEASMGKDER